MSKAVWPLIIFLLIVLAAAPSSCRKGGPRVGSKAFTESVILGEMVAHLGREESLDVTHYQQLGGTPVVFKALRVGEIDIYPDYTGTIREEILADRKLSSDQQVREVLLNEMGIHMSLPLGFVNPYALAMKEDVAETRGIRTISDLKRHPDLKFGFSNEFMDRRDGWPQLSEAYGLGDHEALGIDHEVAYRLLDKDEIQIMDSYYTDANIRFYNLRLLEDDLGQFPEYHTVYLYRADLQRRAPRLVDAVRRLEGNISEAEMMAMNGYAALNRVPEKRVAADFLNEKLGFSIVVHAETIMGRIWRLTKEHLDLVRRSLAMAILVSIPLGIVAAKFKNLGQGILAVVGIIQTIPGLALLVLLIGPADYFGFSSVGSGSAPATIALFLYCLLPIVRNTFVGLNDIPAPIRESAEALGLSAWARLRLVELPLASRMILAGIKTAAVINVGFATLGAFIGAGGYGQPILTGIRLNNTGLLMQGAIPAALLALAVQGVFELSERFFVPKGLRLSPGE